VVEDTVVKIQKDIYGILDHTIHGRNEIKAYTQQKIKRIKTRFIQTVIQP